MEHLVRAKEDFDFEPVDKSDEKYLYYKYESNSLSVSYSCPPTLNVIFIFT